MTDTPLRLTRTVSKGGCAAKIAAGTLSALLRALPPVSHPDLLAGHDRLDDAAVWRLTDDQALVQTLDFFTPVVDDPADFGAIAAANALSDVFAMGARPLTALTILAFPLGTLPDTVLTEMLAAADATVREAGALLVGGHSIEDDTLKLGFSVTGIARPERVWHNGGARLGDVLVLTKALGTGTLAGARKNDEIDADAMADAIASMRQVNRLDLPDDLHASVHAATDITGFGLAGHALHIAQASRVTLTLDVSAVPRLNGALDTLRRGIVTKAHGTNTRYVTPHVAGRDALDEVDWLTLVDPQTSGGLLLAVEPSRVEALLAHVSGRFPSSTVVGSVGPFDGAPLRLTSSA